MVYLDNAATTFPKPESVYTIMDQVNRNGAVNAGRGAYKLAKKATKLIDETKIMLRQLVHADMSAGVIFSPSITIALNQIVHGLPLRNNAVIYVSPFEHNAVARSIHSIAGKKNLLVKEIPINGDFEIDIERMKYEFAKDKPEAVFCTHISNVTGYILPVDAIFREAKRYGSITVLDTAQSLGLINVKVDRIPVDLIAFAGHKTIYGPFGVGGFINVTGVPLEVFICGGTGSDSLNLDMPSEREAKYEAASQNIVAIAGFNTALKEINPERCFTHEKSITEYLINKLTSIKGIKLYLPKNLENHVGIVSLTVEGINSEDIGIILDEDYDIAVRTGYHCAPFIHKYLKDEGNLGTVRVSFGQFSSTKDVDQLLTALNEIIEE